MSLRVLVSTTSFLDTPGVHRERLRESGMQVIPARGPLNEEQLIDLIQSQEQFDGFLCGEDQITIPVLEALSPRLKVISKYGVGLERINLEHAQKLGIQVLNTPRVNHTTVAELTFGLVISMMRQLPEHNRLVHAAQWSRRTGFELAGKTFGVVGLGRVGKEVVKRALVFGMNVLVYNTNWSSSHEQFVQGMNTLFSNRELSEDVVMIRYCDKLDELLRESDVISLHMNLSRDNQRFIDQRRLAQCKRGAFLVNVSRGGLVDQQAIADAITSGPLHGYGADVLDPEPVEASNPLLGLERVLLTPHIASRTYESVSRQGLHAVENLIKVLQNL